MKIPWQDISRVCVGFTFPVILAELLQGNYGFVAVLALALAFVFHDFRHVEVEGEG